MSSKVHKATLLALVLGFLRSFLAAVSALEQSDYPTKPINILISYAAGGVVDTAPRALIAKAEKTLEQPFIATNNGAGGATVATAIVTKQRPDGYNLLATASVPLVRIPQFRQVPYTVDELVPVMQHAATQSGLVVQANSPFKTLKNIP